jgi:hypothetical protein
MKYLALACAALLLAGFLAVNRTAADGFTTQFQWRTLADALTPVRPNEVLGYEFRYNGSTWDRARSGSAAVLAGTSGVGSTLVTAPGHWAIKHTPAVDTQATISKAAGAAGVRHVCTAISATLAVAATAQTSAAVLNLRDGATGAGTILWSKQVILPANGVWDVDISGLNIVGTAATAMTLEFAAAGASGSFESVSLAGYSTQ